MTRAVREQFIMSVALRRRADSRKPCAIAVAVAGLRGPDDGSNQVAGVAARFVSGYIFVPNNSYGRRRKATHRLDAGLICPAPAGSDSTPLTASSATQIYSRRRCVDSGSLLPLCGHLRWIPAKPFSEWMSPSPLPKRPADKPDSAHPDRRPHVWKSVTIQIGCRQPVNRALAGRPNIAR